MEGNNNLKVARAPQESRAHSFWEMVRFALLALLIVIPIRVFVAQPFIVSGNSMVPTFHDNDYLIVDELSYRFAEPARNDVVVFRYPKDISKFFIKRIIGLPNDTLTIDGSKVTVKNERNPEGFVMEEPFVKNQSSNQLSITLKNDEYFVMGDNRIASSDSRIWGILPRNLIVGRAFVRLLPLYSISYLPGAYSLNII
ncbi:MAG TPA: signal peptidase I [Candidatus Paceibacterota bacterium]